MSSRGAVTGSGTGAGAGGALPVASVCSALAGSGAVAGAGCAGDVSLGLVVDAEDWEAAVGVGSSFLSFFFLLPKMFLKTCFILSMASGATMNTVGQMTVLTKGFGSSSTQCVAKTIRVMRWDVDSGGDGSARMVRS
jgi:hypothetical protein